MQEFDSSAWSGDEDANRTRIRALVSQGAKIAGGAVGAAIGFFAGGPAGAAALGAAGTMVSEALSSIGDDVAQRMLAPREKVRVGGLLALSAARIDQRVKNGEQVRSDGFFDEKSAGRSDAEEIAESILLKAQRESEEKKLPYMANLLSNIVFLPDVSIELAQQLAKLSEALTYRQLCILSAVPRLNQFGVRSSNYRSQTNFPSPLMEILYETYDLAQRGLLNNGGDALLGIPDLIPSELQVQGLGGQLFNLMQLNNVDPMDTVPIIEAFQ